MSYCVYDIPRMTISSLIADTRVESPDKIAISTWSAKVAWKYLTFPDVLPSGRVAW